MVTEAASTIAPQQTLIWGGVPPRNPNFIGREGILHELNENLTTSAGLPHVLHGLAGVGKSQLAIEYAYRHQQDFDIIWWISAELPVLVSNSLVELSQRLGLGFSPEANIAVKMLLDVLKSGNTGQIPNNWLLIFDNAESPADLLPYLPNGGAGRILVTTRNAEWINISRTLEVDVFHREESKQLLKSRTPCLSDQDADRIASLLGDFPLAVEQAAAWRAETGITAAEYLELLTEKQVELLSLSTPLTYQKPVAAAWNLSLEKLKVINPTALRILQICAFLAPEPVPFALFSLDQGTLDIPELDHALKDRLLLSTAMRDINRYSLARIDQHNNSIHMHRLVQAVVASQMTEAEQSTVRQATHVLLAAGDSSIPESIEKWSKYAELYPHVIASRAVESSAAAIRKLVYHESEYLWYWGDLQASYQLAQQAYDTWSIQSGPDHTDTLEMGIWLGYLLWALGRYQEAAKFNERLLAMHQSVLGIEHKSTISVINSVTGDRRASGNFAEALELSKENYQRCCEKFGNDDLLTINVAHNVGVSLRLSGQFAEALSFDKKTWRSRAEIYGEDHVLTLNTQIGMIIDQCELGGYLEARAAQECVVAKLRNLYGSLHKQTLLAIHHLATMRRKGGDHEAALMAAEEAVRGLSDRYGENHPDTIAALLSKSICLRMNGDIDGSYRTATATVERYRAHFGGEHPHSLSAVINLATVHRVKHEYQVAKKLDDMARAGLRARLSDDHPSILAASVNLANDYSLLGAHPEAYELDVQTKNSCIQVLGKHHPTTLVCHANLAKDLDALGRHEEAAALHTEVAKLLKDKLGSHHPAITELIEESQRANCDIDPMPL